MILSNKENERYAKAAQKYGITLLYEVFADRAYTDEGALLPRSKPDAVLHSNEEVMHRAKLLYDKGVIQTISGKELKLQADTLCVHGDNEQALQLIKSLHQILR